MSWNYRVVKFTSQTPICFGLFEVYYNDEGQPWTMCTQPITVGESEEDVINGIKQMLSDAQAAPVLVHPIEFGEPPDFDNPNDAIPLDEFMENVKRKWSSDTESTREVE